MRLHDCALETKIIEHLKDKRIARRLSLAAVADKVAVSTISFYQWETGLNAPVKFESWNRWAEAVGADPVINEFDSKPEWRAKLREKRKQLKMSRPDLAERFGVSHVAVHYWETKHGPGSLNQWDQWSASLKCGPVVNEVYRA